MIFQNLNSRLTWNVIELKAKAREVEVSGNQVPDHIKLPNLQEILKMKPPPTPDTQEEEGAPQASIDVTPLRVKVIVQT
jgi:hypothetical protein